MRCGSYWKDMTLGTRGTASSVMNLTSLHFTVMAVLMYAAGKGRDWSMRPSNQWMVIMAPQSWYMVPFTRAREWTGGAKWNPHPHMLHWASPRKYASLDDERFWTTLCVCPQQCQAADSMWYGTFLEQQGVEVMDCPARSLSMNPIEHVWNRMGGPDPSHGWPRFHCAIIAACCALGVGCSSPKKGEHLVESTQRRVCGLLAFRGGHTKY